VPISGEPLARITRLTESDWEQFADLRLRALTDALGTADHQYRSEARFSAAQWRLRLRDHAQFAVFVADRPVGLIAAYTQSADTVYLYSLWLDPAVRGHGLARQLVGAVLDWARRRGARLVTLRMAADNRAARAVYESHGFRDASGGTPGAEVAMMLRIG
jgi:RimJ/RimL family protein N-acetyltransferase